MAYETLIVAYDRSDRATEAVRAIRRLGVPSATSSGIQSTPARSRISRPRRTRRPGPASGAGYSAGTRRRSGSRHTSRRSTGGTVISVRVMEDEADRVRAELDRYGPLDVAAAGHP